VLDRLELHPLSELEVSSLVEAALGAPVEHFTRSQLWSTSAGNALFLRELLLHAFDQGAFTETDGVWRLRGQLGAGPRVVELLGSRLGSVTDEVHEALELLALSEPIGIDILERCVNPSALAEAERRELLSVHQDGKRAMARLAHPLYGEVLRERMPALRTRTLRSRLADMVELAGMRRREDVLRVAVWRLEAGGKPSSELLMAAGEQARIVFDYDLMARLARTAWEEARTFKAGSLLTKAYSLGGRQPERLAILDELEHLATDDCQRADVALDRATALAFGCGEDDKASAVLLQVEHTLVDPGHRDRLRGLRALVLTFTGRAVEGAALAEAVLESPSADEEARVRALRAKAQAAALVGRYEEALAAAKDGADLVTGSRWAYPQSLGWFWTARAQAMWLGGWFSKAEQDARIGVSMSEQWPSITLRATARFTLGRILLAEGWVGAAVEQLRESVALFREEDAGNVLPLAIATLTQALAHDGHGEEARAMFRSWRDIPQGGRFLMRYGIESGRAWSLASEGQTSRAAAVCVETADNAGDLGLHAIEGLLRYDGLRLGRRDQIPRLVELGEKTDGPLGVLRADYANAVRNNDGDGLDAVGSGFAQLPAYVLAAEAATQARLAHQRAGSKGKAAASAARATAWLAETGGAQTPITALAPGTDSLTQREREIARLAATGLSNREIADRLVVSIRTVESHVYRACAKLGVTDRHGLAGVLDPL
jgi:DNA-binding CsgD family transcriptional regulator